MSTHLVRDIVSVAITMLALVTLVATPVAAAANLVTPAAQLRVTLDRLLAEHAFLTMEQMRLTVKEAADLPAAAEAVEANTSELQAAIAATYGSAAATRFGELWRAHIAHVVDYGVALKNSDARARDRAVAELQRFRRELASFLASANPRLRESTVTGLLEDHLRQLQAVASFADEDYSTSYATARQVYGHMFMIGDALAAAIAAQFPHKFPGANVAFSPASDLRVRLDRLLGEHSFLAAEAMRAAVSGAAEFDAVAGVLEQNSADLQRAIGSIYGPSAARAFGDVWRDHITAYVSYVRAAVDKNETAKEASLNGLGKYGTAFSALLANANPNLRASTLAVLLRRHSNHLVEQVDHYTAGNYGASYRSGRQSYQHMFALSDALSSAIATQFPEKFPTLPATSTAGDADGAVPRAPLLVGVPLVFAGAVAMLFVHRGRRRYVPETQPRVHHRELLTLAS